MTSNHDFRKNDLGAPIELSLSKIALDPNNPRIARKPAPGYDNPGVIFDPQIQEQLVTEVYKVYRAAGLEASIIAQGWIPVDQILVWEHPSGKGHIVVEGNTRVSLLKQLPARLERERKKLDRMIKASAPQSQTNPQKALVARVEQLIADTKKLTVYPVIAKNAEELKAKLPRLLGVRHVVPAQGWGPYATNLYIISLYENAFYEQFDESEQLRLDEVILERIAAELPLKPSEIRRNIQAASAFSHFRSNYEEKIEEAGNKLSAGDQHYFDEILANPRARDAFEFTSDRLHLTEEGEQALFDWAFAKPRKSSGEDRDAESENVFEKAEDIRIWQKVARYDAKTGTTNFASRLNIANPEDATPVRTLASEMNTHREQNTPIKALNDLLNYLKQLKVDTLLVQGEHLKPMMEAAIEQIAKYIKFIDENASEG